jgi:hypothetical protein
MKKILILTIIAIGFIGNTNAGTVTLVRGDEISSHPITVVLLPSPVHEEPMRLRGGEQEKIFHDVKKRIYTSIGFDYGGGIFEELHCDKLQINVTNNSRHIIRLDGNLQTRTITCTVKED